MTQPVKHLVFDTQPVNTQSLSVNIDDKFIINHYALSTSARRKPPPALGDGLRRFC